MYLNLFMAHKLRKCLNVIILESGKCVYRKLKRILIYIIYFIILSFENVMLIQRSLFWWKKCTFITHGKSNSILLLKFFALILAYSECWTFVPLTYVNNIIPFIFNLITFLFKKSNIYLRKIFLFPWIKYACQSFL